MSREPESRDYILGHSDPELHRLRRQAEVYRPFTEDVLRRAGLKPGMSVLDVGCGVGDVSFAAASLVGPGGTVRGIDRSDEALALARARAEQSASRTVVFDRADIDDPDSSRYDAVVGRFILLHQPDPEATVARLAERLRPGGAIAFVEMDLSTAAVVPPMPLFDRALDWIRQVYVRLGFHVDMGSRLYAAFRSAKLEPELVGTVRVEGGRDAYAYEYVAETVRSLLPRMAALGIADPEDVDVETLAERIRAAALSGDHCFFYPRMIGAFARKPW